ncbi:MAG TPA: hypothetical protein ENI79_02965 [Rhodospirillales bacterium]|nr:hypothetical protein [Rhodospirillales bacterium]
MLEQEYDRQTATANGDVVRVVAATQTMPFAIRRARRFATENKNILDRLAQGDFTGLFIKLVSMILPPRFLNRERHNLRP